MKGLAMMLFVFILHECSGQDERWLLGTGITYDNFTNTPGLNANVTYRISGNFHLGPDFSALLNRTVNENGKQVIRKEYEFNFNGQQIFELTHRLAWYPLFGLNWSKVTIHPVGEPADERWVTAFNFGTGMEWKWHNRRLFVETKYVSHLQKWDATVGILFPLNSEK